MFLPNLCFLAKASMDAVGSEPIDRKQIIGVLMSLSSHMTSRFRITPSAYCENKTSMFNSEHTQHFSWNSG